MIRLIAYQCDESMIKECLILRSERETTSMEKHYVAVAAVLFNSKNEFLLLKYREHGIWVLPGGAMEKDETVMDCLRREFREELGEVQIDILGIAVACSFAFDWLRGVSLIFVGTYLDGEIKLSDEHDAYRWTRLTEVEKGELSHPYDIDIFQRAAKLYPLLAQL